MRNSLDARLTLKVLALDEFVEVVLKLGSVSFLGETDFAEDSEEHALETLEVPVLVDAGSDHSRSEH